MPHLSLPQPLGFPGGTVGKHLPAGAGDARNMGLIPGLGRSPGGGNGNLLQYSCLEYSMDRGAWGRKESDTTGDSALNITW